MKFKNILVTGGAGYVGAVLVPKLLQCGYQVTILDWFIYGPVFKNILNPRLKQIKGDLRDKKTVSSSLHGIEAVIHLACISNDPSFELNPDLGKSVNYDATRQLVDLAKKTGVRRFIYASSSSVYGIKKETEVTEDLTLEPLTDYSRYKVLSENYLLSQNSPNFTVLVLRPATVCGYSPRLRLDLTVNLLTMQALTKNEITVLGGTQLRPNIHIADMTDLYVTTLSYPSQKISGEIFNVGYQNYSLLEIAQMIKNTLKKPDLTIKIVPTTDLRSYRISSRKIKQELGFLPHHTVEEAISDLYEAYVAGKIPNAENNDLYYNIRTMKQLAHKFRRLPA